MLLATLVAPLRAQDSVQIGWNAHPSPEAVGYRVFLGTSSGTYDQIDDVLKATTTTLQGLSPSTTYYCAIQVYNAEGLGSRLSPELAFTTDAATRPEIAVELADGTDLLSGSTDLDLGNVILGASSPAQTFTIFNRGTSNLTGLSAKIQGANPGDFVTSGSLPTSLAPGAEFTFAVSFVPTTLGDRQAVLSIASNDADENPFLISLHATGDPVPVIPAAEIQIWNSAGGSLIHGSTSVAFGARVLGATATSQTFTIHNTGNANLTGISISRTGTHAADFSHSVPALTTLAPGASTSFIVSFVPTAAGNRSAALHIASNDADENPFIIPLSGVGTAVPEIAIQRTDGSQMTDNSTVLAFGSLNLGAAANQQVLTIRNTGSAHLTGLALSLAGSIPQDFTASTLSANTLAPGASTNVTVSFRPTAAGLRSATLVVASNDADENPFEIPLTGLGVAVPEIEILRADGTGLVHASSTLNLGSRIIGAGSASHTLTIRNTGTANLSGISASLSGGQSGDFATNSPSSTLAPGSSTTLTVSFNPGAAGTRATSLRIASNDADENPFLINLRGTGIAIPDIQVTRNASGSGKLPAPGAGEFGEIEIDSLSNTQEFTISNAGSANLTGIAITVTGPHPADFIVETLDTSTLSPGTSTSFGIAFNPTSSGLRSATLRIASNDPDENPYLIELSGTATIPVITLPELAVTSQDSGDPLTSGEGSNHFGQATIRSTAPAKTFVVQNTGESTITGLRAVRNGDQGTDFLLSAIGGTSLEPGETATFKVIFRPLGRGARKTAVEIVCNESLNPLFSIPVVGYGIPKPEIAVSVSGGPVLSDGKSVLNFGSSPIRKPGITRTITITNQGSAFLKGLSVQSVGLHSSAFRSSALRVKNLAPGKSTSFRVTFAPKVIGTRWAAIQIKSNDPLHRSFDIVLTGKGAHPSYKRPSAAAAPAKTSAKASASPSPTAPPSTVPSIVIIEGQKYRCITIVKSAGNPIHPNAVEVSGNLVDWSSGSRFTTVVRNNANELKVRDNTPVAPGTKRFIRLRPRP